MSCTIVTLDGVSLDVKFTYHKGFPGSWEEPPEPPEVEIEEVLVGNHDILSLLDSHRIEKIEEFILTAKGEQ